MFKNATYLSFYFADNQLFSNSETLVNKKKFEKRLHSHENYLKKRLKSHLLTKKYSFMSI